jgi:type IV pilus assembly protein PilV
MMNRSYGFSLIEVLIAVFVVAMGIVGAAGLQLASIRTSQQSGYQSAAVALANELADKMRANDAQMRLSDSQNPFLKINYNKATDPAPAKPTLCYTTSASCDATALANAEIYEWLMRMREALPEGRVVVCRDSAPFDSTKKMLTWTCTADTKAGITIKIGWKSKNPDGSFVLSGTSAPPGVAITVESYVQ